MKTRPSSTAVLAAAALASSFPYAAAFMPSLGLRLSKPLFRLPAWRPPDAGVPGLWPGGAAHSEAKPFLWRPGAAAAAGRRRPQSRLHSSAAGAAGEEEEEEGDDMERLEKVLSQLDGGRVIFDESDDWGVDLPPYHQRPAWAPSWVPTWAVTLHPLAQATVTLVLYFLHMLVLSKVVVPFPVQVLPNRNGLFQSIGLDSLAGVAFLAVAGAFRRMQGKPVMPDPFDRKRRLPFSPPAKTWSGLRMARVLALLVSAYISSGSVSQVIEETFQLSALNVALGRAVQVLAGHVVWVVMGVFILHLNARPFFGKASRWMRSSLNTYWVWWAIGGYYVSSLAFHISDTINQLVLPPSAFNVNSVVTQMINPEGNDVLAMAIGSIAPCLSAPWWEEVLYRGFLLPALYLSFPPIVAAPASAVVFAAHHMSLSGMIPLATLGLLWAVLYVLSGNLLVPILIHCLWNSRVFLGSYWGV